MKILFLHMTMGLVNRGSEISTDLLASGLSNKHDVMVLQSGPIVQKTYQVKRVFPLDSAPHPAPKNLFDKISFRFYLDDASQKLKKFTQASIPVINKFRPDIIVSTNGAPQLSILKNQGTNAKIVVFGRAGIGYHDLGSLSKSPDLFIALSPKAGDWANQNKSDSTKVVVIPNPLDLKNFSHAKPASLNLPHPVIMTAGALSEYKNIDKVVEAVQSIDASLLVIGDGEKSASISRLLKTFPHDFSWIKHLENNEMPGYYATSQVFCFIPDSQESFGRVYLEAMASGLPIVASDDPIRREIIGEKGIYVDPYNLEQIRDGINRAIQLGKVDYSQELKKYELKNIAKKIEAQFYELIK